MKVEKSEKGINVGGGVSLNKLNALLREVSEKSNDQKQYFEPIIAHINKIAGTTVWS